MKKNPILEKEVRVRMRSKKNYILLISFLIILCAYFFFAYLFFFLEHRSNYYNFDMGRKLFIGFSFVQLALVLLISPALTWGSISSEKEKQTFDMLLITLLTKSQIIWGKYISPLLYVFQMIILSIPLAFICMMFGGLSVNEVFLSYFILLVTMFFYGFIGFFCSNFFKKTYFSTLTALGVIFFLGVGTILIGVILHEADYSTEDFIASFIFPLSPFPAMVAVFETDFFLDNIQDIWQIEIPMWGLNFGFTIISLITLIIILQKKFQKLHRK